MHKFRPILEKKNQNVILCSPIMALCAIFPYFFLFAPKKIKDLWSRVKNYQKCPNRYTPLKCRNLFCSILIIFPICNNFYQFQVTMPILQKNCRFVHLLKCTNIDQLWKNNSEKNSTQPHYGTFWKFSFVFMLLAREKIKEIWPKGKNYQKYPNHSIFISFSIYNN